MFESRVQRQIEAAHHNGPEGGRCFTNHGHTWHITAVFEFDDKVVSDSPWGWGPDFSTIKKVIDAYDHQDLNSKMDVIPPSAENFARVLYDNLTVKTGFTPKYVQVGEGGGNSVRYHGHN